ncbi:hypothetical protein D0T12_31245 [Actinomadura spongiicola]|uniref:REase associating with pPIWI RE domain-containing protein n=1 Tax=Actinomadura spongiicola TaxID=2303421 RepID=A0A372G848_9ACTN|nr:HU-CCDC81 and SPOR domain-containing protein [Actinomadura spongiicola]RFS81574.1 hypothetical protein D0T12_31245 [Actinomadura spongiicola]
MAETTPATAPSFFDGEVLMRLIATAMVTLSRQRAVPNPVYPAKVQNAYNHLVLRCLEREVDPPGSVAEMISWASELPLERWPVSLPEELLGGDGLLVDKETRTPTQTCLEWEVNAADPAAELFENDRLLDAIAVCRAAQAPDAYTAFRRHLTTRPVLMGAELAELGGDLEFGLLLHAILKRCYETAPASYQRNGVYMQCERCRCLMVPTSRGGFRCELDRCRRDGKTSRGTPLRGNKGGVLQLSRPLRMFITSPGLAETDLEQALISKFGIKPQMWPNYDAYDLRLVLPNGQAWAVDVKDRVNPVLLARTTKPFRTDPPFDRAFLVVPRYRFAENDAYGRIFARHLPEAISDQITLLDDQAFLKLVSSARNRPGGWRA